MNLVSVVIPCRNEEKNIEDTLQGIIEQFDSDHIDYEILVVNDNSSDYTENLIRRLSKENPRIKLINNEPPYGFGNAIRRGLKQSQGQYIIIAMADSSDDPKDMVRYLEEVQKGYDCCFGSRWMKEADVKDYPILKLFLNRLANSFIRLLFGLRYNDVTNAFKCYSRKTIDGIGPILSHHFNITVELPLKAIVRGFSYQVIPTNWNARQKGRSSLKIREMGSRYLFIIIYVLLEKWLTGRDYKRRP